VRFRRIPRFSRQENLREPVGTVNLSELSEPPEHRNLEASFISW